jgi:thiamine kinase-like enzyme
MNNIENYISQLADKYFNTQVDNIYYQKQPGGFSKVNNLCLSYQNKKFLLRCFPVNQSHDSRAKEILYSQAAADLKIAPTVHYVDAQQKYILLAYVEGRTLNSADFSDQDRMTKVSQLMNKLHLAKSPSAQLAPSLLQSAFSSLSQLNNHQQWLEKLDANSEIQQLENTLMNFPTSSSPIHNDPNPFNFLIDKQQNIYLIDWTDAGCGQVDTDISMLQLFDTTNSFKAENILIRLRVFLLFCWSLLQAQIKSPSLIIEPNDILKPSDRSDSLQQTLYDIVDHKTPLTTSKDFLKLSPVFYNNYRRLLHDK